MRLLLRLFLFSCAFAVWCTVSAFAEDNITWTGSSDTNFSNAANWLDEGGNVPGNMQDDHRMWINVTGATSPVLTASNPYPGKVWDLNIGVNNGSLGFAADAPGTLTQTGGLLWLRYALNIGVGVMADPTPSSYNLSGNATCFKKWDGGDVNIGTNGGSGVLSLTDNASFFNITELALRRRERRAPAP